MNPYFFLTRASISTVNLAATGSRASPERKHFSRDEAILSLSGLAPQPLSLALVLYCGFDSERQRLFDHLMLVANVIAARKKLRAKTVKGCVLAALYQFTLPLCGHCAGVPNRLVQGELVTCSKCNGSGRTPIKRSHIAHASGISRQAIKTSHVELTDRLIEVLSNWNDEIGTHVRKWIGSQLS